MLRVTRVFLCGVACLLAFVTAAGAQIAEDNGVSGTVLMDGGAVAGAVVVVRRVEAMRDGKPVLSNQEIRTQANSRGEFALVHLLAGEYVLEVRTHGVRAWSMGVVVRASGVMRVAAVLNTPASVFSDEGFTVATNEVVELPDVGRTVAGLMARAPSAGAVETGTQEVDTTYLARPLTQSVARLEGVQNTQRFAGGEVGAGREGGAIPLGAVESLHEQNGVVDVVARRGTAQMHGNAFFLWRESAMDVADPTAVVTRYAAGTVTNALVKPQDVRQQFGGRVSGPLGHGLYGFYAVEGEHRGFPAYSAPSNPRFFALTASQVALLENRGVAQTEIGKALTYLDSLMGVVPRRTERLTQLPRIDWDRTRDEKLSVLYRRAIWNTTAGTRTRAVVNRGLGSFGSDEGSIEGVVGRWERSIGRVIQNELRAEYLKDFEAQKAGSPLMQEPIGPVGVAPQVNIAGEFYFGQPAQLNRRAFPDERRVQIADQVRWSHKGQTLTAGVSWNRVQERVENLANEAGSYLYDSVKTGGLVDWITDYTYGVDSYPQAACPSITATVHLFCFQAFSQRFGNERTSYAMSEREVFVRYRSRLARGLSVDAGLRYVLRTMPLAQAPNAALDAAFGAIGSTSALPEDRNNLAPSVGLSWALPARVGGTLHASYGVSYGTVPGQTVRAVLADTGMATSQTSLRVAPSTEVDTSCSSNAVSFGYPAVFTCVPQGVASQTNAAMFFDKRFRLPMVQRAELSLEHEVGDGFDVKVNYVGVLTKQLPNSVDVNIAPSTSMQTFTLMGGDGRPGSQDGQVFVLPVYTGRVNANFGPVTDVLSNVSASYHAGMLQVERRLVGGMEVRASYTFSKALDYGQAGRGEPDRNGQFDPFDLRYDHGVSRLNRPQRLVMSGTWRSSDAGRWRSWTSGWSIAGVLLATSGRPYSYNVSGGTSLRGGRQSLNGSGGLRYLPTVGPNTLRLPPSTNLDLRVSKTVPMVGRFRAVLTGEAFNVTNHVNYSNIVQRAFAVSGTQLVFQNAANVTGNEQPFGTRTETSNDAARQRQLQVGVRVEW